ncbi:MAG: MMPL family transporter, partial [Gammaproteobacteria bacterium]|nr:MMPL family transporter [Gammaproteobacteria bacterium]
MTGRRSLPIALWLAGLAVAAVLAARTRYVADMSAFLPADPTPAERLLTDLLRSGPASRTILVALQGGTATARARLSMHIADQLRRDPAFLAVANGDAADAERGRRFLFDHRYLLSAAVTPGRFTAAGLHAAIAATIDDLTTPAGPWLKSLLPRDPTGEVLRIAAQWEGGASPRSLDGVWMSASGRRALLVAQLRAPGSDIDAEQRDIAAIRSAYRAARRADGAAARAVRLELSGPAVFAVAARAKIERAAFTLSLLGSLLVVALLFAVYRSAAAVLVGLVPVLSGALAGIAAVAATFGYVHGLTLGFGITLIGEAVDYSVYYFIQSGLAPDPARQGATWRERYWPTVRLGALTSACGFAALASSGFTGLAQLGVYSIGGIVAAALTTRYVLPRIAPRALR